LIAGGKRSGTYYEPEDLHQILFINSNTASHSHEMLKIFLEFHKYTTLNSSWFFGLRRGGEPSVEDFKISGPHHQAELTEM
jgi:hypothetical protein